MTRAPISGRSRHRRRPYVLPYTLYNIIMVLLWHDNIIVVAPLQWYYYIIIINIMCVYVLQLQQYYI